MADADGGEQARIAQRAGIVASGTLTSRILGAARDSVIAAMFPVAATDAFFVAFTIPNALRALLAEGAVSGAFVPVFTEVREKEGMERARAFYQHLSATMLLVLGGVSILGVVAAAPLVTLYAAGYADDAAKFASTVTLTRIVFPYIFFMGVAALGLGVLNALKRFVVPAFAPSLLNVAMIAAALTLVPFAAWLGLEPIAALAIGALIGGFLQVGAQVPELRRAGMWNMPRIDMRDPYVRKAMRLLVPLMVGLGIYQVNVILARLFASFLPEGSQSFLYYGQRVVEIPQGLFALAIASAALPSLALSRSRGDENETRRLFSYSLRLNLLLALPSTVALVLLAKPTVVVLFQRGSFDAFYVSETARSLAWQAAGIWAVASVRTVVPMFHAYNDTRTPVICSAVNLVVFGTVSGVLMGPMQHAGIAVGISAAAVAQLLSLLYLLRRRAGRLGLREVLASALRIGLASAAMGAVAWGVSELGRWERGGNDPRNIVAYVGAVLAGAGAFVFVAKLLRAPELDVVINVLRRRRRKGGDGE